MTSPVAGPCDGRNGRHRRRPRPGPFVERPSWHRTSGVRRRIVRDCAPAQEGPRPENQDERSGWNGVDLRPGQLIPGAEIGSLRMRADSEPGLPVGDMTSRGQTLSAVAPLARRRWTCRSRGRQAGRRQPRMESGQGRWYLRQSGKKRNSREQERQPIRNRDNAKRLQTRQGCRDGGIALNAPARRRSNSGIWRAEHGRR